ncbi:DNA adenine methylase [Bacillus altitudinis]|nr:MULTISPECIES: DNA adenine methylase [Bacillus]MCY1119810.1 DNA adenine methylase [Bacillus safensis]MDM5165348.1 DNA adenine methylase [Bacillus altitudinis]NEU52675.1 DNA adenine methylase [Bacillus altitudinis]QOV51462.1 DNA adenine methylase [Bacillus altitudinis]
MASVSPLRYPGGKDKVYQYVRYLVNTNNISSYIEPFAGGAAVALRLLINGDVNKIIINDYDRSIYAFWNVVVNNPEELIKRIIDIPINIDQWYIQKEIQGQKNSIDELSLALSTLFLNRTNRSGIIKAGVIGGKNQTGDYKIDCRFNKQAIIRRIELISSYSKQIRVCNYDAKEFIKKEIKQTRNSLTFFDPPYYDKGPDLYTNFYSHDDHVELAKVIKNEMNRRYWILTYDISDQIKELYKNYYYLKYFLNYSISKPTKGQEFIFFSKKINSGDFNRFLNLV